MSGKLEAVILHVLGLLKTDVSDYCTIETTANGTSLVMQDGSIASIVQFEGTKCVLGRDDFELSAKRLEDALSVFFNSRGHQLGVIFRRDLDGRKALEDVAAQQTSSAARLNLNINDLINENVEKYAEYIYQEECYFVFWSRPSLLDPIEVKLSQENINEFRKANNWPAAVDAQNLLRPNAYLLDRHDAFVARIVSDLSSPEFGCALTLMKVDSALRAIRANLYPDLTGPDWTPSIPDTDMHFRWKTNDDKHDASAFGYPPIPGQVMIATAEVGKVGNATIPDPTTIRIGSRIYAPLLFSVPPRERKTFNDLFNALNRAETRQNGVTRALPYLISFMLESDGMSVMSLKAVFAQILGVTSEVNRNITLAVNQLREYKRDDGCVVKLCISAMTWANADREGLAELAVRKNKLWRSLESWGRPTIVERTGNPMLAVQSNGIALSAKHIGNPCPAPLYDAIYMLPLSRPTSPFSTGSTVYRSLDGKMLRYQRFSSDQTTWITLIAGKPGSGKSVLMNNNNLESCLLPGLTRLPYVGILDVGVSSAGFIEMVQDALPSNQRHLAVYKRIQNNAAYCINPMDTPLGSRMPLPKLREFLRNFLSILVTPPERRGKPYEGMSNFVARMIDLAYMKKNDKLEKGNPETYKPGHNSVIDNAVKELGIKVRQQTTYWTLVDQFFDAGRVFEAEVAQRYAMPTLNDLAAAASSEEATAEYGDDPVEGGTSLIKTFQRGIREAVSDYPLFSQHTRYDVGSARIISLDLQDVVTSGDSDAEFKQTALMYMIARQTFMKKITFSREDLPSFEERYLPYYQKLISDIVDDYKVLCMDEFHKTGGHEALKNQIMTDGREARKWNLEIILASQLMEDFGSLTKIATSFFMLDAGSQQTQSWMRNNIGLSDVEQLALDRHVHGPGQHGATFLARFVTKSATYSQLFTMTPGPMRLWALTTTAEDRKLRQMLYDAMPKPDARRLLADKFPSGSCKRMIDRLKEETFAGAAFVDDDMEASVIDRVAKEMIQRYYNTATTSTSTDAA